MDTHRIMPVPGQKYRLITRSDMDGLVCGVLLKELDVIDTVIFVHPKDMQDGKVPVTNLDITTNLPYVPGVYLAFDHHASERTRNTQDARHVIDVRAPSAAQVVYEYFGGRATFPYISPELMAVVNKADSAQFTKDEVLNPRGWVLLSFIMDNRTGLGRFREFNVSNYQLMMQLVDYCRTHHNVDEILQLLDVRERVDLYREHADKAKEQIKRCTTVRGNMAVLDLRGEDIIYCTNRFTIYALFPQCNISCHVMWGKDKQNTVLAVGKSIFDRNSRTNVGELMLTYGGGGHVAAGTCQVDNDDADQVLEKIVEAVNKDG